MAWNRRLFRWARSRDIDKVMSDANKIGFDAIRGGLVTFVVNIFVPTRIGIIGALTFLMGGLIIWTMTLPRGEDRD